MKMLIKLLVVGLAFYSAFLFGVPFYHYMVFKSELMEVSKLPSGPFKDGEMMLRVQEMARDIKVPLQEEDIILTLGRTYKIEVSWEETVNWLTIYQKTFQFEVDTSKAY